MGETGKDVGVRKRLSADGLFQTVRGRFAQIPDPRQASKITFSMGDAAMAAFAMFSLKDPSLLAFDGRRQAVDPHSASGPNLQNIYGIERIPCDSQMREILDPVSPEAIVPAFADIFRDLQRGKALDGFCFLDGHYLLALDGTGYFSSEKVSCDCCLKTEHRDGRVTYAHHMIGAAIVHPDRREVIPLAPEPIIKQDGTTKNDCERNAVKRQLEKFRRDHPRLKVIVVEDALASNAPHIRELQRHDMRFLLGVKPGDHAYLFDHVCQAHETGRAETVQWTEPDGTRKSVTFINDLPLNESNADLRVNFLHYIEVDKNGKEHEFTWVTDLELDRRRACKLVLGGRARWRIENETFNTLKNQGYQFEHNFGHGDQNLSVVLAMIMMLAFCVDQVQQICCALFNAIWQQKRSKRALWETIRAHFDHFVFESMEHLFEVILTNRVRGMAAPPLDSS